MGDDRIRRRKQQKITVGSSCGVDDERQQTRECAFCMHG
jgi:hypothetical protein